MQCKTELVSQVGLFAVLGMVIVCPSHPVQAQITPDNTLGAEASQVVPGVVVPGGQGNRIEGGAIRGAHLFHSFSDFNVGNGQRVYFDNPAGVLNIFSRVTGNSGSNILGTLGVDGMANLYLLNPNGIVFGPNARLDVAGSFVASTANRLVFDDGQFFGVLPTNQPPLLQINVTPGLQYGNNLTATIRNQGNLQVGQNLTLGAQRLELAGLLEAGRDITLQGWSRQLSNADYTIGGYLFTQDLSGQGIDLLIPHENVILANGDVRFTQNYEGKSLYILAGGQVSGAAGANNITITGTSDGSVTRQIATGTGGVQTITVTASDQPTVDIRSGVDWSQLTGELPGNSNTSEAAVTFGVTTGDSIALGNITNNGGDIALWAAGDITANDLDTSVSRLSSSGEDVQGIDGGAISLVAAQDISLAFIDSYSFSNSDLGDVMGGDGGAISFVAGHDISLAEIVSSSRSSSGLGDVMEGDGGAISLVAGHDISLVFIDSYSSSNSGLGDVMGGDGGAISFVAGHDISRVFIDSSSSSSSFSGDVSGGDGGAISLVAGHDISLYEIRSSSSSSASSGDVTGGNGGAISFNAGQDISLDFIYSDSDSKSDSDSGSGDVTGGNGGAISFNAGYDISLDAIRSSSSSSASSGDVTGGNGGAISFNAEQDIIIDYANSGSYAGSASPYVESGDVTGGDGGAISFNAGQDIIIDSVNSISESTTGFEWSASSEFAKVKGGNAGGVAINARRDIIIGGIDSSSQSGSSWEDGIVIGGGNGGNVSLVAGHDIEVYSIYSFSLSQSDTEDVTGGDGNGGNISLVAQTGAIIGSKPYSYAPDSSLLSFSVASEGEAGDGGNIALTAATQIRNFEIATLSSFGQSGNIQITGLDNNLDILNISVVASKQFAFETPFGDYSRSITFPVDGEGESGNISISGTGNLTFTNSSLLSDTNSTAPAGNVIITSPGFITFNNSFINTNTQSTGTAGNIQVAAPQIALQQGSEISTSTTNAGSAGNIAFDAATLAIIEGSEILATTTGTGNSGQVTINATDSILLGEGVQNFAPVISVETSNAGAAGDIFINTPNFVLSETARITATATATATNPQGGGSITISANRMDLAGIVGIFAETAGQAPGGVLTLQPYPRNPDLDILLAPGAQISASTSGSGNGGDLIATAPQSITISGPGRLAVETSGTGTAGNIIFRTQDLSLTDGATVSASTTNRGAGGDITIDVSRLNLGNNASIAAETANAGAGGSITLSGIEQIDFTNGGTISASTAGSGAGGSVLFENLSDILAIRGDGVIAVETSGDGRAGSFAIAVPTLNLNQARLSASTSGASDGGNIILDVSRLNLSNESEIEAVTRSSGTAGSINISPYSNDQTLGINFYGSNSLITSSSLPANDNSDGSEVTGNSGAIFLSAPELIVLRGDGDIKVETETAGDAGTLTMTAPQIIVDGVEISASTEFPDGISSRAGRSGIGGDITLNTAQITFANEGEITAATSSTGQGGNIFFNPNSDTLTIQGNGEISVETEGDGRAGSFEIAVPTLNLSQARLSASTSGTAPGGDLQFNTTQLNLNNGAEIVAESFGTARAGNIFVRAAEQVFLANGSSITVNSRGSGAGGRIDVTADELVLRNNSSIAAETNSGTSSNNGRPQGVFLSDLRTLSIWNSEISASTATGTAGTIEVDARESITLSGRTQAGNGGLRVEATNGGTAGNLMITTQNLLIEQNAQASVSSPIGLAGNLSIYAGSIRLDQGSLLAKTGGTGGSSADNANIVLQAVNNPSGAIFLWMENNSLISAQAVGRANGGNIDIDAGDGFIIATHLGNSDIIATAEDGSGGNINLASFFTIGLAEANPDLSFDDLRSNRANDISASSEFGQQGSVLITNLGFDPGQGITELPTNLLDASSLAEQSLCEAGVGSEFTVTGRGGLPSTPIDALSSAATWEDWSVDMSEPRVGATPSGLSGESLEEQPGTVTSERAIVEAQGWIRAEDGRVALVADAATVVPDNNQPAVQSCRQLQQVVSHGNLSL